jgi:hypothetical protein
VRWSGSDHDRVPNGSTGAARAEPYAPRHRADPIEAAMNHRPSRIDEGISTLSCQEKRRCLTALDASIWDIEAELARVREARAELMTSLQTDIRAGSMIR